MRRVLLGVPLVAVCAAGALFAAGSGDSRRSEPLLPTTQRVLLKGPVAGAAASRGVFLRDPLGQVEVIAGEGHLVAWTVRTPADSLGDTDSDEPINLPRTTSVVVADERGGRPLTVAYPGRWISSLRFVHLSSGAAAAPVLSVSVCRTRDFSNCAAQELTLTAAPPVRVAARLRGKKAQDRSALTVDRGRELLAAASPKGTCVPPLAIKTLATGASRALPPLPPWPNDDDWYPDCESSTPELLNGRYAFVSVQRSGKTSGLEADIWYGLDTDGGPSARWHDVQHPYRYSDGSTGYELGPAVTDSALIWEELDGDSNGATYSVERVRLPADLRDGYDAKAPTESDPVRLDGRDACAVAATVDALYELDNGRCAPFDSSGDTGGGIHRLANPGFRPPLDN